MTVILSLCFYMPMQAQILDKLSKGLKRVNNAIENVEKATKSGKEKKQPKNNNNPANTDIASSESSAAQADNHTVASKTRTPSNWRLTTPTPHLSHNTRFIHKKVSVDNLPMVSEGIFHIQEYNRAIGYGYYYGFWTVDGKCLFPAIYEGFTDEQPRFDSGACVVKEAEAKRHSPMILYADGRIKPLSHEWEHMTQFHDGVAMVREIMNFSTINLFYINTKGEKIWPHLAENNTKGSMALHMRDLREGRRAFYSNTRKAWGFLDEEGRIAIQPTFRDVRDFHNGYALAIVPAGGYSGKPVFINTKGETVSEINADISSLMYASHIGDISGGYYTISENSGNTTTYYDLTGKAVRTFQGGGSTFADGSAFVALSQYDVQPIYVVNRAFNVIGKWPVSTADFCNNKPEFNTSPYYTFRDKLVMNHLGEPVMYAPGNVHDHDNIIGQFSQDGYAKAKSTFADRQETNHTYTGYVDLTGRYTVVFCEDERGRGPWHGGLPGPQPALPEEPRKPGETLYLQPGDTIPAGPTSTDTLRYNVSVVAMPAAGGKVYGSGKYRYGDTIRVTGTPAEGYLLTELSCSRPQSQTNTFNRFVVKGDMTITCHFTPKDTVRDVSDGCFAGTMSDKGIPAEVYLQLGNNTGNKFSEGSRGFMAVTFDTASAEGSDTGGAASMGVNIFFVPMNVLGLMNENGRKYLCLDGGILMYGNLRVSDNTGAGLLNNPMLQMMLAFDGAGSGELQPARYRVEIISGKPEDKTFTLGKMQRKSPAHGWISADDPQFHTPLGGFFIKRVDKGLGADFFDGIRLDASQMKSVPWTPPEGFYGPYPSLLEETAESLGKLFRAKVKDSPFSDYDMRQFSTDIDNHLFKGK